MERYVEDKKKLYTSIQEFVENSENELNEKLLQNIINLAKSQDTESKREEMLQFLVIIKNIEEHHHRNLYFNEKINRILLHYKEQIKNNLTNNEIYHIFENNKKIVLFLLKNDILTISEDIYKEMLRKIEPNGIHYYYFFIPEIKNFIDEVKMEIVKNELLTKDLNFFNNYEEKRQEGENDSYICSLIRQDSIEEFISYINYHNISLSSQILPSIFETNSFLNENTNITLIEYSAFFGSIQIFQYLIQNKVELTPSLWLYAIHSNNAELIDFLESNKVPPPAFNKNKNKNKKNFYNYYYYDDDDDEEEEEEESEADNLNKSYIKCLIESIKCHHNDIANYIENNYLVPNEKEKIEIISNCIKYHNYSLFHIETIIEHGFFYLNLYHYEKLVELLLKKKEKMIEKKKIEYKKIFINEFLMEFQNIFYF